MSACAPIKLGFLPLTDAGVLIVAAAKGFFADEGLAVTLSREASWATVRDKLAVGALDGAHLLAPMAFAATLGVATLGAAALGAATPGAGSDALPMIAPLALNLNGAAITLSSRLSGVGGPTAEGLARLVRRRAAEGASELTFAVVYRYSTHNYLLRAWMAEAGIDPDRDVRLTVAPPPRMAELLADGVIEGFCAGEPWNAAAEAAGAGRIAARASGLLGRAPDKVLGLTEAWSRRRPDALIAMLRALIRAGRWIEDAGNRREFVALLARPEHVGVSAPLIEAGLADITFHRGEAAVPEPAHGVWMLAQMARWGQIAELADPQAVAERVYRPDLYRAAMAGLDA